MSESIGGISMEEIIAAARNGLDGSDEPAPTNPNIDIFSNSPAADMPAAPSAVYCQNCGAEIGPDEKFCSICGCPAASANPAFSEPVSVPTPVADVCPSCGAPVMPDEAFCQNCGCALNAGMPAQNPYDIIYCQNCGAEIGAGENFCQACGCPVDGVSAPVYTDPGIPAAAVCPGCGQPVTPGNMFCELCGFALGEPQQPAAPQFGGNPNVVVCPDCGRVFGEGQRFCEGCGRPKNTIVF